MGTQNTLISNMVIFQDPTYLILGVVGGLVSLFGFFQKYVKHKEIVNKIETMFDGAYAALIGTLLTPIIFLILYVLGEHTVIYCVRLVTGATICLDGYGGVFNSFYFIFAILMAFSAVPFWMNVKKFGFNKAFKRGKNDADN